MNTLPNQPPPSSHISGPPTSSENTWTSREILEAMLASAPIAIVMVDRHGHILYANGKFEELFGYPFSELEGQTIEILIPDRFRADHEEHRHAYAHNPHVRSMGSGMDLAGRRKSGEEFPIEAGLSYVRVGDELIIMGSITDITRRKHIEEVLEWRVEERTREIERRRMVSEGLRDVLTVLNSNQTLENILRHIVGQACHLLHADAAAIYRVEEATGQMVIQASTGLDGKLPEYEFQTTVPPVTPNPDQSPSAAVYIAETGAETDPDTQRVEWKQPPPDTGADDSSENDTDANADADTNNATNRSINTAAGSTPDNSAPDAPTPDHAWQNKSGSDEHAPAPLNTRFTVYRAPDGIDIVHHRMPVEHSHHLEEANDYQALLTVPLTVKDDTYGNLVLYYEEMRRFSSEEIELATMVGDQTALAIENARLRTQIERTAIAAERSRIARDLHDSVTQTLFSASLIAEVLPRLSQRNPEETARRLDELRQLTRGALAEMRTLLLELRPATLIEVDFRELLRQLTEAIAGRSRMPVELEIQGDALLPPDIKIAFYHIAQEALNNVAKHARARKAQVVLFAAPHRFELSVIDDGTGFVIDNVTPEHLGLTIMHERAEAIHARLSLHSELAVGTRVTVEWQKPSN